MADKIFTEGLWANRPHENAPDFVIANCSVDMNQFSTWARQHVDSEGKLRFIVKRSQSGKYYAELDTYRRDNQQPPQRQQPAPMPTFQAPVQQTAQQPQQGQGLQGQIPF